MVPLFFVSAHKESDLGSGEFSRKAHKLERLLAKKLAEYLDSHIVYSLKRLLAADLKNLYVGSAYGKSSLILGYQTRTKCC